jgi:hypothetical protein
MGAMVCKGSPDGGGDTQGANVKILFFFVNTLGNKLASLSLAFWAFDWRLKFEAYPLGDHLGQLRPYLYVRLGWKMPARDKTWAYSAGA